jgi:hypothetical protein
MELDRQDSIQLTLDQIDLPEIDRGQASVVTLPDANRRSFHTLVEFAQWSAANAIGKLESKWLKIGREVL